MSIIEKFIKLNDQKLFTEDTRLIYRVSGGMPIERLEEEFSLSGIGNVKVKIQDVLKSIPAEEASGNLDHAETRSLFQKIREGLYSLIPRSEARFLPDSLVGSITIHVEGEEATLYFLVDEDERVSQDKPMAPKMVEAIRDITEISKRLLKKKKEKQK